MKFREKTEKQRNKIREIEKKEKAEYDDGGMEFEEPEPQKEDRPAVESREKLTADSLSQLGKNKKPSTKGSKKRSQKPAWATTEKQQEEEKEAEVDELIDFAYDLDYEQYMEDYEIRQALAIIKQRVNEIKEDGDWKQNIADEWNEAAKQEQEAAAVERKKASDAQSVFSYSKSIFIIF